MKKPGETAVLKVLRDGKEQELSVILRPVSPLPYYCIFFICIFGYMGMISWLIRLLNICYSVAILVYFHTNFAGAIHGNRFDQKLDQHNPTDTKSLPNTYYQYCRCPGLYMVIDST